MFCCVVPRADIPETCQFTPILFEAEPEKRLLVNVIDVVALDTIPA